MSQTTVAVLGGSGRQGGGIAQRLARAGHRVVIGSRDPSRAAATVAKWPQPPRPFESAAYADAAAADVVILAIPFTSIAAVLDECARGLRGNALVIDVTVPLRFESGTASLIPVPEGSAAEHIRARLPAAVRLAATFKTVPADLLNQIDRPLDCDEFVCGDSEAARSEAAALVAACAGLRPVDVGPLPRARSIEHMTLLAIGINRRHKVHDARFRVVGL